ncbi:MAG: YbaN family protein [Acidobacteria bacterium]|nr:YbaN family protein [Acidobacteriota bacterium]
MGADYIIGTATVSPMPLFTRAIYVVIGLTSVGFAGLGAVLPGLPTTVFLLIALWAFARSSDRLHAWVRRVPIFREALVHADRYHAERTISRGVKLIAVSCAWGSVALFFLSRGLQPSLTALVLVVLAMACTIFMTLTRTATDA